MGRPRASKNLFSTTAAVILLVAAIDAAPAHVATGRFEVYCDGVGLFLTKIDGAPVPGRLLLFLHTGVPGVAPNGKWEDALVYRDGCAADGKCEVLAHGRVCLDKGIPLLSTRASGKYAIELGGKQIQGEFTAKLRHYKYPSRFCE